MNTTKKFFLFSLSLLSPTIVTEKIFAAASASTDTQITQEQKMTLDLLATAFLPVKMSSIGVDPKQFKGGADKSALALPYLERGRYGTSYSFIPNVLE